MVTHPKPLLIGWEDSKSEHPTDLSIQLIDCGVSNNPPLCHPERSRGTCSAPFPLTNFHASCEQHPTDLPTQLTDYGVSNNPPLCCPDRSGGQWRDLLCALPSNNSPGKPTYHALDHFGPA